MRGNGDSRVRGTRAERECENEETSHEIDISEPTQRARQDIAATPGARAATIGTIDMAAM